jgi:HJR/Mrr/RecB family endonuclease|nr:MAG TPA: Restriction endonuclease [Caudoviricetes sp.]
MFNFFNNPIKRYKAKSGRIKSLYEYKLKLSEDVKLLKLEKRNLLRKITECKKNAENSELLRNEVKTLQEKKSTLEVEIAKLYKAKELTLNLKELESKEILLKSKAEELAAYVEKMTNDLNKLREEKGLLIENIDTLKLQQAYLPKIDTVSTLSIEYVDEMQNGLDFEKYFANILDKLGYYDIKITSSSGDFGIDITAYNDDILYGFQCKLYSNSVSNKAIQEAYSGKKHYNCNVVIVVTNNYFTEQAKKQAEETNVILWDRNVLINKLNEASKCTFTVKM